ncbi:hypothetical protein HWV62_3999 [Athelia sp. TMB]|nr:hypothetical protein HWV62_3999 [Athelia sp. TMB]
MMLDSKDYRELERIRRMNGSHEIGEASKRPIVIFNTSDAKGGTVNNVHGNLINGNHIEHVIHVYINKPDDISIQQFLAASTTESSSFELGSDEAAANLARIAFSLSASQLHGTLPSAPSYDRETFIGDLEDTRRNNIPDLPLELRIIVGLMDALMENASVRYSPTLPVTLASLRRIMKMTELALRIYQHTPLAGTLGMYLMAEAEHCRQCLQNLLANVSDWRHGLSAAMLHAIRQYVWSGVGEGCAISELNSKLREVHTSLASCILALGRRVTSALGRVKH